MKGRLVVPALLALCATCLQAADAPAAPGDKFQPSMNNYDLSGMDGSQKRRLADSVAKQQKQLGHGMGGLEENPAAARKAKPKKQKKKKNRS